MVPRPIGLGAPQCARCGKSVYMAEQVIGPFSKPYHKPCLTCIVCNKRLDSTLLVEHEGDPYCKNCHKAHLGQGKGGFGLAVPLRPDKPSTLQSKPIDGGGAGSRSAAASRVDERLNEELSGISISSRPSNPSPTLREPVSPSSTGYRPSPRTVDLSRKPTTVAQSIDHLVSSGVEVPIPYSRNGASHQISQALYGGDDDVRSPARDSEPVLHRTGSPKKSHEDNDWQYRADLAAPAPSWQSNASDMPEQREPAFSEVQPSSPSERQDLPFVTPSTPSRAERQTIGTIRMNDDGLPTPQRKDPIALARERERGLHVGGNGAAKTYSPRTTPVSPSVGGGRSGDADRYGYSPNSALTKMGLGSTVSAASVGTPLCARCERPVYFAEQKQAAGRKWHRGCLRCDGCSTTLESGKLEEGPLSAAYNFPTNIWCRTCYAKRFGPKGIGVAGMSLPETMR